MISTFKNKSIASEEEQRTYYTEIDKIFEEQFKNFKKKNKILYMVKKEKKFILIV